MKAVIQRVNTASVTVDDDLVSSIENGLFILLGVGENDTTSDADFMIRKIPNMRIFSDENEKMNLSVKDINGEILLVSQFTLYADAKKGNRPSFISAMAPDKADELYKYVAEGLEKAGVPVKRGIFGAHMIIGMEGNGPVTILLES